MARGSGRARLSSDGRADIHQTCHDIPLGRGTRSRQCVRRTSISSTSTATASRASPSPCRACRVADPAFNAAETIALLRAGGGAGRRRWSPFPSSGLSAYTCDDLFHQRALLDACEAALGRVVEATARAAAVADRRPAAARRPPPLQLRRGRRAAAACSASCRRPTCRTTASSTRRASSMPADTARVDRACACSAPTCRSAPTCSSRRPTCRC